MIRREVQCALDAAESYERGWFNDRSEDSDIGHHLAGSMGDSVQKSEGVTEAIIFYNEHGPNNLKGLWRVNEELRKNYAGLEKHLQALTAEIDRLTL